MLYFYSRMSDLKNPLDQLDHQELLWLTGILKDACREKLEKNLVSQAFESRLYQRGPVKGRLDPRPFLKIWEPRYRKFLAIAEELHTQLEADEARAAADGLRDKFEVPVRRQGPGSAQMPLELRPRARR
jgi:hypothetical protein